jgi:hypothetical protein
MTPFTLDSHLAPMGMVLFFIQQPDLTSRCKSRLMIKPLLLLLSCVVVELQLESREIWSFILTALIFLADIAKKMMRRCRAR